jgi:hypothetical protein
MPTDMPVQEKSDKHWLNRFFRNGFVQGAGVCIALAVAFSGKLDSRGVLVMVLVAGAIGAIGIYTHCSSTPRKKVISAFLILAYGCLLWAGYSYLTFKPVVSAGNTTKPQEPPKQEEKKPEPAKKEKPKPDVSQRSQGDNSPNTNQQSSGAASPNIAITNSPNSTINYNDPDIKARLEEIKELLLAQQGNRIAQDKLLMKYPLGYVIFDIDLQSGMPTSKRPSVLPYETHSPWEFDWSPVRLKEEKIKGQDAVWLTLPDIKEKSGHGLFMHGNNQIGGPKKAGPFAGGGIVLANRDANVGMKIEILAIREDGIVFLFGFTHP